MQREQDPQLQNEQKEQDLEALLRSLPKNLSEIWRAKAEEFDSFDDGIELVRNFINQRVEVKEKIFTKIHLIQNEKVKKDVREVIHHVASGFGNPDTFLGEGTAAKVYRTPYAPNVCVKYITELNMLEKHGNTMSQEIQYLEDLDNFSVEGIRVPKVYFEHISDQLQCFGMETIEGKSIDQIIARPDECDFLEVIQKQDMKDVLRKMKAFVEKMHEEMKIVHRDFATRNIMVDKSGNWYVIDFGKAKRIEIGDTSTDMSQATDFPSAENAIRKLFAVIY